MTISLSLLGGAGWQFLDNSGNVLSGGLLYTYAAGTTTPLTTYTSLTGLTANSNPIVLDSAGRVPYQIWLTDGSAYKFVLQTSASVQIGAWDNVYAPGVNSISFGTTGLTPATATQGVVTVAGTLNVANGGTGLTSLTAGRIPFGNGTAALNNSTNLTYTTGTNTFSAPIISAATSMANAGNMLFSGTASRIQGDFSNATFASRTAFQDKTTNNPTSIQVLPNGTSQISTINCFNNSDPTNASAVFLYCDASVARLGSGQTGSGTYLPFDFVTNNAVRGQILTGGAWTFGGTAVGSSGAGVLNAVGYAGRDGTAGLCISNVMNTFWLSPNVYQYVDTTNLGAISIISDYRIKQNVVTQTVNAVDRINALRPVQYEFKDAGELFKADGITREGFIAHELQAVIPSAVFGQKDELTEDGEIQPQSLKLDALVSVLTKAVQELSARVAVLEARP